jgi:hypothetical protein
MRQVQTVERIMAPPTTVDFVLHLCGATRGARRGGTIGVLFDRERVVRQGETGEVLLRGELRAAT